MQFDDKTKLKCFAWEKYLDNNDLEEMLEELDHDMIMYCYAIHDKDTYKDGTLKKVHVHVMINYGQPTTYKFIKKCYKHLAANEYIEPLTHPDRYYKYMYHDQEIEASAGKYYYGPEIMVCKNGFNPEDLHSITENERTLYFDAIMQIANDHKIYELASMYEYLSVNNRELFKFAMNNTILIRGYMDSHRNRNKKSL